MAKSLPSHRTRPALYASRNWLSHRRRTPASSSPSKSLCDSYYVGPSPRPRHERHGEFPMMLPDEEAVAKEADLLLLNDPSPFRLEQLYTALQRNNNLHTLSTYCEDAQDWVPWTGIPFRTHLDGTRVPYAPGSWERIGIQRPFYCPHVSNDFRSKKDCEMEVYRDSTLGKGKERWVARARQHNCRFMVVIPPLDDLKEAFTNDNDIHFKLQHLHRAAVVLASLNPFMTTVSSSRLATSSPSWRPRLDNFYDSDEILERSDLALKTKWMSSASRYPFTELGLANTMIGMAMKYFNSPEAPIHPAADNNKPPRELVEFHPSSNPSPPQETFEDSMITRALLEWNSRIGIPQDAWDTVATARVQCRGCDRVRSFDGDAMHRDVDGLPLCGGPPMDGDDEDEEEEEAPVYGKGKGRAV
ncbi:hypothetical protein HWV62_31535 [Athelia sp. TMB]|nr:hypothetical protein HWV62_31535 [Athelia sp. TMB]